MLEFEAMLSIAGHYAERSQLCCIMILYSANRVIRLQNTLFQETLVYIYEEKSRPLTNSKIY